MNQLDHRSLEKVDTRLKTIFPGQDGENTWLAFNGFPMYDENGRITHYFGMSRNETALVQTEIKLKKETQKALESEQLKNSFLLNMSYEIRTPLATVLGFAELLDIEHDVNDEPLFVEEIKRNTNTLLALVNDIFIDEELLGKVIEMLAGCSISFTEEGSIRAKYEYRQGCLNITIEDTGIGIAKEVLPHIFERFCRDQNQRQCGTGLVLPIIKGLVELMGGTIEFMS